MASTPEGGADEEVCHPSQWSIKKKERASYSLGTFCAFVYVSALIYLHLQRCSYITVSHLCICKEQATPTDENVGC